MTSSMLETAESMYKLCIYLSEEDTYLCKDVTLKVIIIIGL